EVRRDVADPQSSLGGPLVGMRLNRNQQRIGVAAGPSEVLGEQGRGVDGPVIIQGVDQAAMLNRSLGKQFDGLAVMRDRLVESAQGLEGNSEIAVGGSECGTNLEGATAVVQRFIAAPLFAPRHAQVVECLDAFRIVSDRFFETSDGGVELPLRLKGVAQVDVT